MTTRRGFLKQLLLSRAVVGRSVLPPPLSSDSGPNWVGPTSSTPGGAVPIGGAIPEGEYWRYTEGGDVEVSRPADMFRLLFRFHNLRSETWLAWWPRLRQIDATKPALIEVEFYPQLVSEGIGREPDCSSRVDVALVPPTRLVFRVLSAAERRGHIPFTREALLDWNRYAPNLAPQAAPVTGEDESKVSELVHPEAVHTALELIWRLTLSPHSQSAWVYADRPVYRDSSHSIRRAELWHARLASRAPGGGTPAIEGSDERTVVRAVWAADMAADPYTGFDDEETGVPRSLTRRDRYALVHLTSNYSRVGPQTGGVCSIVPKLGTTRPLAVDYLHLSSLGTTLRVKGRWPLAGVVLPSGRESHCFSLIGWDAAIGQAREEQTVTQNVYYAFPHGTRVIVTKTVGRWQSDCGSNPARLQARDSDVSPYDDFVAYDSRLFLHNMLETPFRSVRLGRTRLHHHRNRIRQTGAPGAFWNEEDVFWPVNVDDGPISYTYEWRDLADVAHAAEAPCILVSADSSVIGNAQVLRDVAKAYYEAAPANASDGTRPRRVNFALSEVSFAERQLGDVGELADVAYATQAIWFKGQIPSTPISGAPPFIATVEAAEVALPAMQVLFKDSAAEQLGEARIPRTVLITALKELARSADADLAWDMTRDAWVAPREPANRARLFAVMPPADAYLSLLSLQDRRAALQEWSSYGYRLWDGADSNSLLDPRVLRIPGDKVGALASPDSVLTGLTETIGAVSGEVLNAAGYGSTARGEFDPTTIFQGITNVLEAKLLGIVPLSMCLKGLPDVGAAISKSLPRLRIQRLPKEVRAEYSVSAAIASTGPISPCDGANEGQLVIRSAVVSRIDASAPSSEIRCELSNIRIDVVNLVKICFDAISVEAKDHQPPRVTPRIRDVEFTGAMQFIRALASVLPSGGLPKESPVDISLDGLRLDYGMSIPSIGFGVFSLANIRLGTSLQLPFTGKPPKLRFAFASLSDPFHLSVAIFGGGGHVGLTYQPGQSCDLAVDASLEFGGYLDFAVGVASGGIGVAAGVYFDSGGCLHPKWGGYLRAYGYIDVLGLITVRVAVYIGIEYVVGIGISGGGYVLVEIDILFFSADVRVPFHFGFPTASLNAAAYSRRDLLGPLLTAQLGDTQLLSGDDATIADPTAGGDRVTFADMFPTPTLWAEYCNAFIEV